MIISVMSVSFYEKPQIDFDAIMDIVAKLIALVVASGVMAYFSVLGSESIACFVCCGS